jgi:hypothetical protein
MLTHDADMTAPQLRKCFVCVECGKVIPDYEAYERQAKVYCGEHLLNTAQKRAYERWFVKD